MIAHSFIIILYAFNYPPVPRRAGLQEPTFVDSVLLVAVFDLPAVRGKFSCKNLPKFTARPELGGRTNPEVL